MAQMVDIDDFLPDLLRYAPDTSDLVAYRVIRSAARELCERLRLWRESDQFAIVAPRMEGISTFRDADIVSIEAAFLDGQKLEPKTVAWLDDNHPDWSLETTPQSQARYVTQLAPNTVTVYPGSPGDMKIRMILRPSRDALALPDFLLNDYQDEVGRGAAARVLTEPNSQNPQLGLDHRQWFAARLDELAIKAAKGQQGAPLRTKARYF